MAGLIAAAGDGADSDQAGHQKRRKKGAQKRRAEKITKNKARAWAGLAALDACYIDCQWRVDL
jgi:hypothetical protein